MKIACKNQIVVLGQVSALTLGASGYFSEGFRRTASAFP